MSLKDQIADDIAMFFDLEEMGSEHVLEGRTITLVVDADQAQKNSMKASGGIYDGDLLVFARKADLSGMRVEPNALLRLDGRTYCITSALEEDGIMQLTLAGGIGGN